MYKTILFILDSFELYPSVKANYPYKTLCYSYFDTEYAIQNKINQPMEMTINQGGSFNIETAGIIQQIPQSFDNIQPLSDEMSSDYSNQDFSNDDDENFNDYLGELYANPSNFNPSGVYQTEDSDDEDYNTNQFTESDDDISIYMDGD